MLLLSHAAHACFNLLGCLCQGVLACVSHPWNYGNGFTCELSSHRELYDDADTRVLWCQNQPGEGVTATGCTTSDFYQREGWYVCRSPAARGCEANLSSTDVISRASGLSCFAHKHETFESKAHYRALSVKYLHLRRTCLGCKHNISVG